MKTIWKKYPMEFIVRYTLLREASQAGPLRECFAWSRTVHLQSVSKTDTIQSLLDWLFHRDFN